MKRNVLFLLSWLLSASLFALPSFAADRVDAMLAAGMLAEGRELLENGEPAEALPIFEEVISQHGDSADAGLVGMVMEALHAKILILGEQEKPEETLAACEAFLAKKPSTADPAKLSWLAEVLFAKAAAHLALEEGEEEQAAYRRVFDLYRDSREPAIEAMAADALRHLGDAQAVRIDAALVTYDELFDTFGASEEPRVFFIVAQAMQDVQHMLFVGSVVFGADYGERCKQLAQKAADLIQSRMPDDKPEYREALARLILARSNLLYPIDLPAGIAASREVTDAMKTSDQTETRRVAAAIIAQRCFFLSNGDDATEALAAHDEFVDYFDDTDDPIILMQLGAVHCDRIRILRKSGDNVRALVACEEFLKKHGKTQDFDFASYVGLIQSMKKHLEKEMEPLPNDRASEKTRE